MRFAKSPHLQRLEDELGILCPDPLLPEIRARPGLRIRRTARTRSLNYVAWVAFLIFWLTFGRLLVVWYMMTTTFNPGRGVEAWVVPPSVSFEDLERAGERGVVRGEGGQVLLDPEREIVLVVFLEETGDLRTKDASWSSIDAATLCDSGKRPVVVLQPLAGVSYQTVVTGLEGVRRELGTAGCWGKTVLMPVRSAGSERPPRSPGP